ncbi:MAG: cytochrome c peroxidase [Arcobacteraceae bacterium]|nr:cytochrome c peroxidase [Arcobacteraceae bacterium]
MLHILFGLYIVFFSSLSFAYENIIIPIPQTLEYDKAKATLGEKLFFDTILSKDNTISCFSCHNIFTNGADTKKVSTGINNQSGITNVPTLFNAIFNFRQNWNGSAKTLANQAKGPITNPIEMGHNFKELISILEQSSYNQEFKRIFGDGITEDNLVDVLAEFQKRLITPNSQLDKYLMGDENALTQDQKDGYELFQSKGCISCHNGINIGGQLYSRFGMIKLINNENFGLYNVTKEEEDRFYFKVPSLRNVELTPPYFHDGSADNLFSAVEIMLRYQVGRDTSSKEILKIVEFLKSLNGEIAYVK